MRYSPRSLVDAERVSPVSLLRIVTGALMTAPLWASITLPRMLPVVCCATRSNAAENGRQPRPEERKQDLTWCSLHGQPLFVGGADVRLLEVY